MMEVHQFSVSSLEQTCFEVLKDHLCSENCIRLWQFTKSWNIPIIFKLQHETFHFICENFEEVSLCEEFVQLAVQELADILGKDGLTVTQESKVYLSVLRWINHKPEERQRDITTLLPKVRLGLMDKSYITDNVLNNDVVKTNPESNLLVLNTLQVMSQPLLLCSETGINNIMFCRRLPNAVLLIFTGRYFPETLEAFDYITNSWITVNPHLSLVDPMTPLFFCPTVFLDGYLYIVGIGLIGSFNRVRRFNLVTHTWQNMSPMHKSRYCVMVTVLKGCVYAMGGCAGVGSALRTVERYQPDINQWTFISSMNEERRNASCTTLNNRIYICGGCSNQTDLNTAEYYNPDTNQWTVISPMGTRRFGHGCIGYMGHIFAVGGCDGIKILSSAEAYDPVTDTWHNIPETVHTLHNVGIAVMNKRIFVVSYWRKKIVECFDYTTNTWSVVFSDMDHHEFTLLSCCVISGLPNMAEYCSPHEPVIP